MELKMKNLLNKNQKHLLWKDELGDDFILLKYTEVFIFDQNKLRLHCWSKQKRFQLFKEGLVLEEDEVNEPFYVLYVDRANLGRLIAMGAHTRRPNIQGRWIKDKECKLAHKILPYNPNLNEAS